MTLKSQQEVANTREKLARLEMRYAALREQTGGDEELREATMESLKRYINQFKEEIAIYNAHQHA
jgi:hypothetical protein